VIICPLARTNDHAEAALTRSDTPGMLAQDPRSAQTSARQVKRQANPVYAARYQYLISREQNALTPAQAQTVIAAAILRQLHAVITTGQAWDPVTAAHGTRREGTPQAA
jgi:hypothetical protein